MNGRKGDGWRRWAGALALLVLPSMLGCVSLADFRKMEVEVHKLRQRAGVGGEGPAQVADLGARIDELREEVARLRGRVEVAEHQSDEALKEARAARQASLTPAGPPAGARADEAEQGAAASAAPAELRAYREAYAAWRAEDTQACIDRFREFLQTHPTSEYADDAAFWMADCHFKQGDYRTAVLRFDDVAGRYPAGNKAADALYRQGEALLRLGYQEAALKAFERVVKEYPESGRVAEARRQVELLRSAG